MSAKVERPYNYKRRDGSLIPDPEVQAEMIDKILKLENPPTEPDKEFFVIQSSWIDAFWNFVSQPSSIARPGIIDNSDIIDDEHQLNEFLVPTLDFQLLPKNAWNLLVDWYGVKKNHTVKRKSLVNSSGMLEVEMYPLVITISAASHASGEWLYDMEQEKFYSKNSSFSAVVQDLKNLKSEYEDRFDAKGLDTGDFRVYIFTNGDSFERVDVATRTGERLEDLRLKPEASQRRRIMIEFKRKDGTWPLEKKREPQTIFAPKKEELPAPGLEKFKKFLPGLKAIQSFIQEEKREAPKTKYVGNYNLRNLVDLAKKEEDGPEKKEKSEGVGIINSTGVSCYFNSLMQCLARCDEILDVLFENEVQDQTLIDFKKAIGQLRESEKSYISLKDFHRTVVRLVPGLRLGRQEDASEAFLGLIDALEKAESGEKKEFSNTTDDKDIYEERIINGPFPSNFLSGVQKTELTCTKCGNKRFKNPEIYGYLNMNLINNKGENLESIEDCVKSFLSPTTLEGVECESCKEKTETLKQFHFLEDCLPRLLVLQLGRFSAKQEKISRKVSFNKRLKLSQDHSKEFELFGVICHIGSTLRSGHYIAYTKGTDEKWRKFNDRSVTEAEPFQPTAFEQAYILFYRKI